MMFEFFTMNNIRKLWWKFQIASVFRQKKFENSQYLSPSKPRCFVCLAADYGNLGDVAITYAQTEFLKKNYPTHEIIDWPISRTICGMRTLLKLVRKGDVITITGGGNMGDLYPDIELCRLLIVKNFPNNKIIVFPQSIVFTDCKDGLYLKKLSQKVYGEHKMLTLQARDRISYNLMTELYRGTNIELKPDIVLSLKGISFPRLQRNGIMLCLRSDKEKSQDNTIESTLLEWVKTQGKAMDNYDTVITKSNLSICERMIELDKIWTKFLSSELVITDRLHGMIFSYITGTPAFVIMNNNHKIAGCYDWIKQCQYIKLLKTPADVQRILN